jgi:hypothetical protein
VIAERLCKAAELLACSVDRISDIAFACGFNDLFQPLLPQAVRPGAAGRKGR